MITGWAQGLRSDWSSFRFNLESHFFFGLILGLIEGSSVLMQRALYSSGSPSVWPKDFQSQIQRANFSSGWSFVWPRVLWVQNQGFRKCAFFSCFWVKSRTISLQLSAHWWVNVVKTILRNFLFIYSIIHPSFFISSHHTIRECNIYIPFHQLTNHIVYINSTTTTRTYINH